MTKALAHILIFLFYLYLSSFPLSQAYRKLNQSFGRNKTAPVLRQYAPSFRPRHKWTPIVRVPGQNAIADSYNRGPKVRPQDYPRFEHFPIISSTTTTTNQYLPPAVSNVRVLLKKSSFSKDFLKGTLFPNVGTKWLLLAPKAKRDEIRPRGFDDNFPNTNHNNNSNNNNNNNNSSSGR